MSVLFPGHSHFFSDNEDRFILKLALKRISKLKCECFINVI